MLASRPGTHADFCVRRAIPKWQRQQARKRPDLPGIHVLQAVGDGRNVFGRSKRTKQMVIKGQDIPVVRVRFGNLTRVMDFVNVGRHENERQDTIDRSPQADICVLKHTVRGLQQSLNHNTDSTGCVRNVVVASTKSSL